MVDIPARAEATGFVWTFLEGNRIKYKQVSGKQQRATENEEKASGSLSEEHSTRTTALSEQSRGFQKHLSALVHSRE